MTMANLFDDPDLRESTFLGVDPGASGGLAWLLANGEVHAVRSISDVDGDSGLLELLERVAPVKMAVIEKVGGYIGGGPPCPLCKQPKNRSPGSTMFNFGANYGKLLMALTASEIPFQEVDPKKWQKAYSMSKRKGEEQGAWKNRLKEVAIRLFPRVKVTLAISDALLLAEYARRNFSMSETG